MTNFICRLFYKAGTVLYIYMKRIIYLLFLLLSAASVVHAQQGQHRTATTKVADVLALFPASDEDRLQEAFVQLTHFTKDDFIVLLQQFVPAGQGDNAPLEYATNSYSFYVLDPEKETARQVFVQAISEVLAGNADRDTKAYLIRLLQQAGKEDAIPSLTPFLSGELVGEASRALARIGTNESGQHLLDALQTANEQDAIHLINALGFLGYQPAETALLQRVTTATAIEQEVLWWALANIGGAKSEPILRKAAQQTGFVFEPSSATDAYLRYGQLAYEQGNTKLALKVANTVTKATKTAEQRTARVAALDLWAKARGPRAIKTLVKGATHSDPVYRHASLRLLTPYMDQFDSGTLLRGIARHPEDIQVDIVRYLTNFGNPAVVPVATDLLNSPLPAVRQEAVRSVFLFNGDLALKTLLGTLDDRSQEEKEMIAGLFSTSSSEQFAPLLLSQLNEDIDDSTRILLIQLLGNRGSHEATDYLFSVIQSPSPSAAVKETAYSQLTNTVDPNDLPKLLTLLLAADDKEIVYVQEALVSSVVRSDDEPEAIEKTISAFENASEEHKKRFFPVFSGVGGERSMAVVTSYLTHDTGGLQNAARVAIASWVDDETMPILIDELRKAENSSSKAQLIGGAVRLIRSSSQPDDQRVLWVRDVFEEAETYAQKRQLIRVLESAQTYNALAFAGSFLANDSLRSAAASTVMGIALERPDFYGDDVRDMLQQVIGILSGSESGYLREAVRKHLDELPKGIGYHALFNGEDLSGWKGLVENPIKRAQLSPAQLAVKQAEADKEMTAGWYVEDGVLHFNGHGDNIATVKQYGDFELLVDWKLAKDGKDGDAGVYLRGTPQVQIWDTSRREVGAEVGSGGLYNNQVHESKPLVVADNPLGEWNTFRITMKGDRVTVYLNGQLVTDSVVLENYWDRGLPIFPREQIELQAHGTHVSYRDVFIRELNQSDAFELSEEEKREGFTVLFDGTNLDAWTGNTDAYGISDEGTLAITPKKGSGGNLYTEEEFADFVYRFEFRLTPGANNGIGIRAPLEGDAAYVGHEIQVLDDTAPIYKDLAEYQYHGSVYGIIPAKRGHLNPVGEWNEQEIYVKGNKIRVTLNGVVIVDGDLAEASRGGTLDKKDHPGLQRTTGHIAFLGHGSEVHFRNIRVKRL